MPTPSQSTARAVGGYTSGGNAVSTSFSSTPTAGRVILVRGEWSPSYGSVPTGVTISDNQGNTYSSQLANNSTPGTGTQDAGVFLGWGVATTSSGTFTVTATLTGSGVDAAVSVQAFELPITGITLDRTGIGTVVFGPGNTQTITASAANTGANRYVVALIGGRNNTSITTVANNPPATGYTSLFDSRTIVTDGVGALGAWKDVTSTETSSVDWGDVDGGGFFSTLLIATFSTTGGGGGPTTYTITPSGGIALSGTSVDSYGRVYTPSGGLAFSGTNVIVKGRGINPTGGITFAGTVPMLRGRLYTPTGGISLSGTAPYGHGRVFQVSGGIALSGTAPIVTGGVLQPSGGIAFSGTVLQLHGRAYAPTGGLTFSGTAAFIRQDTFVPSGGIVFSGTAPMSFNGGGVATVSTRLPLTFAGR